MSKYTTELRYICETLAGLDESAGYDDVDSIITSALPSLFSFNFPIFDEEYRGVLERKIVKHYYTREICAETVGLWKLYLDRKLNEIMPYYNKLYLTELITFDPLHDIDLRRERSIAGSESGSGSNSSAGQRSSIASYGETGSYSRSVESTDERDYTGTSSGTNASESTITADDDHLEAYSDTPNNKLTNVTELDYLTSLTRNTADDSTHSIGQNVESGNFHNVAERGYDESVTEQTSRTTNETDNSSSNNTGNYSSSITTTESYIETLQGSTGGITYAKKIAEFRKNILNIDMMIIEELSDLFFGLW